MLNVIIMVIIVGILSIISVKALRNSHYGILTRQTVNNRNSRKAAFMILTLSITFMICNGIWSTATTAFTIYHILFATPDKISKIQVILMILSLLIFSLNSGVNPFVYIMRNSECYQYTKALLSKLTTFFMMGLQMIGGYMIIWTR